LETICPRQPSISRTKKLWVQIHSPWPTFTHPVNMQVATSQLEGPSSNESNITSPDTSFFFFSTFSSIFTRAARSHGGCFFGIFYGLPIHPCWLDRLFLFSAAAAGKFMEHHPATCCYKVVKCWRQFDACFLFVIQGSLPFFNNLAFNLLFFHLLKRPRGHKRAQLALHISNF